MPDISDETIQKVIAELQAGQKELQSGLARIRAMEEARESPPRLSDDELALRFPEFGRLREEHRELSRAMRKTLAKLHRSL